MPANEAAGVLKRSSIAIASKADTAKRETATIIVLILPASRLRRTLSLC
jgi:hypothetical protein